MGLRMVSLVGERHQPIAVLEEYESLASARFGPFIRNLLSPIKRALRNRIAEGFAVFDGRIPVAAICYAGYGGLTRITLLHSREGWRGQGHEERLLAEALTDIAVDAAAVNSVVCEAMITSHTHPDQLFSDRGFAVVEREIMAAPLGRSSWRAPGPQPALYREGTAVTLRPWKRGDTRAVGEVLRQANRGSVDGLIYPELLHERYSVAAVDGIVRGSCGRFDPRSSGLLIVRETGQAIGVALCTKSSKLAAFLAEIAVVPEWRGRGLGAALLDRSLARLAVSGYQQVYLGVTSANLSARRLYQSRGFSRVEAFGSYYQPM